MRLLFYTQTKGAMPLKRKILLYLLNLGFSAFLPIFAFMAVIVWVAGSVLSCAATVVLEDVLGFPVSGEDERMLRGMS